MMTGTGSGGDGNGGGGSEGTLFQRARQLVNRHPVGVVFAAAGAGALYAAERAVGVLGGIAGDRPFAGTTAPKLRDQLRQQREQLQQDTRQQGEKLKHQGEQLLARGKSQGQFLYAFGKSHGEQLLRRGRAVWPFGRRPTEPGQQARA